MSDITENKKIKKKNTESFTNSNQCLWIVLRLERGNPLFTKNYKERTTTQEHKLDYKLIMAEKNNNHIVFHFAHLSHFSHSKQRAVCSLNSRLNDLGSTM